MAIPNTKPVSVADRAQGVAETLLECVDEIIRLYARNQAEQQ
jgi:hypothetical protein